MTQADPLEGTRTAASADPTEPLIMDFLRWLAAAPRPYAEVMEAWRTSCPRLTIWEDCLDRGLVVRARAGPEPMVSLSDLGRQQLEATTSPT